MHKIYITIIPFDSCSTPFWYPAAKSFPLGEYAIDVAGDGLCTQQYASQERLRCGVSTIITVIHFSNSQGRNQLWIGGAKVYWEGWTKTTLISNEISRDRIHTYRLQWAN